MLPEPQTTDDTDLTVWTDTKRAAVECIQRRLVLVYPGEFNLVVKVSHIMEQHLFAFLKSDFNLVWRES